MAYTVPAKIVSRRYHVCKNVSWENVKAGEKTNKDSIKTDPYCCAVKAMVGNPAKLATVSRISKEISRHAYFFWKEEGGKLEGFVFSTKHRPLLIPADGLKITLMMSF